MSGTTGLTGSADATFVLEQESRASNAAKLYVTGRDTPYQEFKLRFRDCSWELQDIFEENGISAEMIEHNDTLVEKIKGYADTVPDYRHPSYVRHLLGDIIMITFFAILGNANE